MSLKSKSITSLIPVERVQERLESLGFMLEAEATVVSDGKFWRRMLYTRSYEQVSVSEEIGDAYPKDPVISIYASEDTISKISEVLR